LQRGAFAPNYRDIFKFQQRRHALGASVATRRDAATFRAARQIAESRALRVRGLVSAVQDSLPAVGVESIRQRGQAFLPA